MVFVPPFSVKLKKLFIVNLMALILSIFVFIRSQNQKTKHLIVKVNWRVKLCNNVKL